MWRSLFLISLFTVAGECWAGSLFFAGTPPTLGTGLTRNGATPIFNCCTVNFTAAAGFSVPTGPSYRLDDIQVMLISDGNSASPLSAFLYIDSGGNPGGAPVADLSRSVCPCPNGAELIYTLTPSAAYVLNPGVTYWLVLNAVPADDRNIGWVETLDASPYSGVLSFAGARTGNGGLPATNSAAELFFAVDGTAVASGVPEPATAALLGLGLLAIARLRRRS